MYTITTVTKTPSLLRNAFSILHANAFFVVLIYSLSLLYDICLTEGFLPISLLALILIKLLLYGGVLGTFVELASGQEMIPQFRNVLQNIRKFSGAYFLLSLLPIPVHFSLHFLLPPATALNISTVTAHLNLLILFLLSKHIIYQKYLKKSAIPPRPLHITGKETSTIAVLYLAELSVHYLPLLIDTQMFHLSNILRFLSAYTHLLTYLYLTFLILKSYPEIQKKFDNTKEIFLINPITGGIIPGLVISLFYRVYPPFFVVLKALAPQGYKFREFNRIVWRDRYYKKNKLVAITCYTSNAYEAYKIAKGFKKHGSKVIMGGPHVTYLPEEALEYCDSVVIGEAEGIWRQAVEDYENGCLKKTYSGGGMEDYHKGVHEELLRSEPGVVSEFIETTRGCKFHCSFCTIPSLNNGRVRTKPIPEVVELIKKIRGKFRIISFLDNNIYNDPAYATELFKALKPLKVKWQTFCTIDIAKNEKAVKLAKEGGCGLLTFGYEISEKSEERNQKGKFSMADRYIHYTQIIKKAKIKVKGNFIFGFDSDDLKHLLRLWWFAFRVNPDIGTISLLTPLPGSKLYYDMLKADRIINLNWKKYATQDLVIKHPRFNSTLLSRVFFPFITFPFMATTNKLGYMLIIIISYALYILG